jgi:5-carboxymethyl-2-hydroxymuconate isomerase
MKLVTYKKQGQVYTGLLHQETVTRFDTSLTMREIIASGKIPNKSEIQDSLDDVKLLSPLMPGKILAIGRNYAEHAQELANEVPEKPLIFAVLPSAVIGTGDVISWESDITGQVDWEGELAVIIGKMARHVSEDSALDYVFGYTAANDVSARDLQSGDGQWTRAKGLDTFCPLGPCIVPSANIPDVQALSITTTVDGQVMQNGTTGDMIFNVRHLVAYLSRMFTLHAGDVILTVTPSGVGKGMKPPRFLGHGSYVTVEVSGIGKLTNSFEIL